LSVIFILKEIIILFHVLGKSKNGQ